MENVKYVKSNCTAAFLLPTTTTIVINFVLQLRASFIYFGGEAHMTLREGGGGGGGGEAEYILWGALLPGNCSHDSNSRRWLRSAVMLVVIMGLTWIFGVLIVEVEGLVPLAYIYTIMVAFQGVFIFLILVAFSKQVRAAYAKWWMAMVNESDFLSKYFSTSLSLQSVSAGFVHCLLSPSFPSLPVNLSSQPTLFMTHIVNMHWESFISL